MGRWISGWGNFLLSHPQSRSFWALVSWAQVRSHCAATLPQALVQFAYDV